MNKRWIQQTQPKKGALSKQLGIPEREDIPRTLLNKIIKAEAGDWINNPTKTGKKRIHVTRLMEERAILARTLKNLHKKRK